MANGTIAFDTLQTSGQITGTAKSVDTDYVVNGSAKAWIHFKTSTSTTIYTPSFNITSVTDNGTGNTTVTVTNAFDSTTSYNTVGADDYYGLCNVGENNAKTASVFKVYNYNNSFAFVDTNNISATAFGDLA
jgi:hypothetical protein